MICGNRDIGFRVLAACNNCEYYKGGSKYQLSKLIPAGHCFELLHSLLPYIITFEHNGWFKWERDKNSVVVCCPVIDNNVCVRLQKVSHGNVIDYIYEIKEVRGKCPFYKTGEIYEINKSAFANLCWNLFNVVFPYLKIEHRGKRVSCGMGNIKTVFELIKIGE